MSRAASHDTGRARILVADDEPHLRRILASLLEGAGYEVVHAEDGRQAQEILAGPIPLQGALLDILMPGATGLEVLAALRHLPHRRDLPVVILTAKGQDADRQEAFKLGAADFVTKPFSPKRLLARIHELFPPS